MFNSYIKIATKFLFPEILETFVVVDDNLLWPSERQVASQ